MCIHPQILCHNPKSIKQAPLRPKVSSGGSIVQRVAKEMANIFCPLVGASSHHIRNTQHFIEFYRGNIHPNIMGGTMSSYNVKTLFTSVPVDPALNIIHKQATTRHNTTK